MGYGVLLGYLLFGGGLFMVCMGAIWLFQPEPSPINYYFSVMYLSTGLIVLYAWAEYTGLILRVYPLYNMQIPLCYLFAPLLHFGFSQITSVRNQPKLRRFFFIPFLVTVPAVLAVNIVNSGVFLTLPPGRVDPAFFRSIPPFLVIHWLGLGSNLYIMLFLTLILIKGIGLLLQGQYREMRKELILMILFVTWFFADVVLMSVAHLLKLRDLLYTGKFLSSATFIFYAFYSFRYPEFAQQVIRKTKALRYRNSQLRGLDPGTVIERLKYLMVSEKVFRDPELTLSGLSKKLAVTSHQLSEILNEHLNQNFVSCLSGYRIREAKRLLLKHPDMTIIEVAFEVGFNSKASFNSHFQQAVGQTPREFRKGNGGSIN